jgi:hypothetical protein
MTMNRNSSVGFAILALVLLIVFGFIALYLAPLALATATPVALSAIGTTIGVGIGAVAVIAGAMVILTGALRLSVNIVEPVASKVTQAAKKYEYEAVAAVLAAASTSGTTLAAVAAGVVTPTLEILIAMSGFLVLIAGWVMQTGGRRNVALGAIIFLIPPLALLGTVALGGPPEETIAAVKSLSPAAVIGLGILAIVFVALLVTAYVKDREHDRPDAAA